MENQTVDDLELCHKFDANTIINELKGNLDYLLFKGKVENKELDASFCKTLESIGKPLSRHLKHNIFWYLKLTGPTNFTKIHVEKYLMGLVSKTITDHKKTWYLWDVKQSVNLIGLQHTAKKTIIQYPNSTIIIPPGIFHAVKTEPLRGETGNCISVGYNFRDLKDSDEVVFEKYKSSYRKYIAKCGTNPIVKEMSELSNYSEKQIKEMYKKAKKNKEETKKK